MTDLRKAAEMALEALVNFGQGNSEPAKALRQALRQALAQKQEPVAWVRPNGEIVVRTDYGGRLYYSEQNVYTKQKIKAAVLAEREACAKVCEEGVHNAEDWDSGYWDQCCNNRAAAIRARSEK